MKETIEKYAKETIVWSFCFLDINFDKGNAPKDICDDIDFLTKRFSFEYSSDLYQSNPFIPMAYFKDVGRSVDITDLTEDDIIRLKNILTKTDSPIWQGKIYDLLGIIEKSKDHSITAANIYVNYARNHLYLKENCKITKTLCRALYIYSITKQRKLMWSIIDEFLLDILYVNGDQELVVKYYLVQFCLVNNLKLKETHIKSLEQIVSKSNTPDEPRLELIETIIEFYKQHGDVCNVKKWKKHTHPYVKLLVRHILETVTCFCKRH